MLRGSREARRAEQRQACRKARRWLQSAPIPEGRFACPAALCGLAGYRSSVGLGDWRGAAHLAAIFDTLGWLFRDLRDAPLLANALLDVPLVTHSPEKKLRIGSVDSAFLIDAVPQVVQEFEAFKQTLRGLEIGVESFDSSIWKDLSISSRRSRRARRQRFTPDTSITSSQRLRNGSPGARQSRRMSCSSCAAVMKASARPSTDCSRFTTS